MKIIWTTVVLIVLVLFESSANGQLIPRRNTTRPCPIYRLPQANYKVDDRSSTAEAFSFRFVYLDKPLDRLNLQSNGGMNSKTEITTVTTEQVVSNGTANSNGLIGADAAFTTNVSAALAAIDGARLRAQGTFLASEMTAADIEIAIAAIDNARTLAQEQLIRSGRVFSDISAATTAIDLARLVAQAKLLQSGKASADISAASSKVEAARILAQERLLKSGKLMDFEAARLNAQQSLLKPVKTVDKTTKKTQVFDNASNIDTATVDRDQKLFQWSEDRLTIDHCEISNMAVQLSRNGNWRLNLRADQNRVVEGNGYNPSQFIKRNQFSIVVRCYGNMATSKAVSATSVGQPVLAELKVEEFWVENGKPNFYVTSNNDPLIAQSFDLIDRVAIEFFYYK